MKQGDFDTSLILGTAGHIDHGKSSLINMLTGTNPDRLEEEKKRGITIELGFAELTLPSKRRIGVVDVPGHEKFVRQMIAGATGIDIGMLVVAADDGLMPQTIEHTQIMELLGIKNILVALSKIDLVDDEWLDLVKNDIKDFLATTSYAGARIIPVSSNTHEGKEELLLALDELSAHLDKPHGFEQAFRLPIDRVFTLKGVGTVVTGTLWSGSVATDDILHLYPSNKEVRVRSIQVHSRSVERAFAGQRTALNLVGVDKNEIQRGDTIAAPGTLQERLVFDAYFNYLGKPSSDAAFISGARVHINHGTKEVLGRILLTNNQEALAPKESSFVQIRLEEPLMVRAGDRFIVRSYSPVHLIGGGNVLFTEPSHRTKLSTEELNFLEASLQGKTDDTVFYYLKSQTLPLGTAEIAKSLDLANKEVQASLDALLKQDALVKIDINAKALYMDKNQLSDLLARFEKQLIAFHHKEPLKHGISDAALRDLIDKRLSLPAFGALLLRAQEMGLAEINEEGAIVHPQAGIGAKQAGERTKETMYSAIHADGLTPPLSDALIKELGLDSQLAMRMLRQLAKEGRLERIAVDYFVSKENYLLALEKTKKLIEKHGFADMALIKDELGFSRKYAIPYLEHLDATGVTIRKGDTRVLR
ncbi:MAG: selenocysteine-specific translation elongation factor [Coriobacteriia bacterium]|nr:selenocysteine-specific translation elongation factor [Coriobacteriia bacterium]